MVAVEKIESFVLQHISPPPLPKALNVPILENFFLTNLPPPIVDKGKQFDLLLELSRFVEELYALLEFRRTTRIPVSPQGAMGRFTGDIEDYINHLPRSVHLKDVGGLCSYDSRRKLLRGENIDRETVFLKTFVGIVHDLAHQAQSHLSQDYLHSIGIYIDHDMLLTCLLSQPHIVELLERYGLDAKRAIVAATPPSLLLTPAEEREKKYVQFQEALESLRRDGQGKSKINIRDLVSLIDFSATSEDQPLLSDKKLIAISQFVHDLCDRAYGRTDLSLSHRRESIAAKALKYGKLDHFRLLGSPLCISFDELPKKLQGQLLHGRPPSDTLALQLMHVYNDTVILVLTEQMNGTRVIRAVTDKLNGVGPQSLDVPLKKYLSGLMRVKLPKAIERFQRVLDGTMISGEGPFFVSDLPSLVDTTLSIADYQTSLIGLPDALLGRALLLRANASAHISNVEHVFSTHQDHKEKYAPRHRAAVENGLKGRYYPVAFLRPHTPSVENHWIGPRAPYNRRIDACFQKLDQIGMQLQERLQTEVICAGAPPVSNTLELQLRGGAVTQMQERLHRATHRALSNGTLWEFRQNRHRDDIFSLGFSVEVPPGISSIDEAIESIGEHTHVVQMCRLHRGYVFGVDRKGYREWDVDSRIWLQEKIMDVMRNSEFASDSRIASERRDISSKGLILPASNLYNLELWPQ